MVASIIMYSLSRSLAKPPPTPPKTPLLAYLVQALIDDLPVAKALGQIAPRDAGAKPEQNGFDEQAIVRRRAAHMAFTARQNVFDPIPLVVAQRISSRIGQPLLGPTTHELDIC